MTLPRSKRLARSDFSRPGFMRAARVVSKHFSLSVPSAGKGCAVVIAKKVVKLSVKRHLLKRRVTAILKNLPLPPVLVVYPKASALELSPTELKNELTALVSRVKEAR